MLEWEQRADQYGRPHGRPVHRVEDIVTPGDPPGPLVTEAFLCSRGVMDIGPDPFAEEGAPGLQFRLPTR